MVTFKLKNNLFYSIEKIKKNTYVLKSNFNLLSQVNGLNDLLENENFTFLICEYELNLFDINENKLKEFINGCTLV